MAHTLGNYKHIVDREIRNISTPHPLEGYRDKNIFIKRFVSHFEGMTYEDISGGKNKLYKVNYNNCSYNIYIEAFDGGGRDRTDGSKKISITATHAFKKLIDNGESVLIINEYVPLRSKDDDEYELEDISLYGIIKPEEIYSSKVVRENTGNPSSRWVSLEVMIKALNTDGMTMNDRGNVYVIPSNKLKSWFDIKIIDEQYNEMAKFIFETEKDNKLSEEKIGRIFRDRLISKRGMKCEFCNCRINISDQLVASHINARSNIRNNPNLTDEEKIKLMVDIYNGFLLCRVHDSLFDKKHITFTNDGKLIVASDFIDLAKDYNFEGYIGKKVIDVSNESIEYLKVHRNDFSKRNNIEDLDSYIENQISNRDENLEG